MTVGELFSAAAPAIGSLIIWGILSGIAIGIGFVLLIIPGLILMTIWAVGAPAIVVEDVGPLESLRAQLRARPRPGLDASSASSSAYS